MFAELHLHPQVYSARKHVCPKRQAHSVLCSPCYLVEISRDLKISDSLWQFRFWCTEHENGCREKLQHHPSSIILFMRSRARRVPGCVLRPGFVEMQSLFCEDENSVPNTTRFDREPTRRWSGNATARRLFWSICRSWFSLVSSGSSPSSYTCKPRVAVVILLRCLHPTRNLHPPSLRIHHLASRVRAGRMFRYAYPTM